MMIKVIYTLVADSTVLAVFEDLQQYDTEGDREIRHALLLIQNRLFTCHFGVKSSNRGKIGF